MHQLSFGLDTDFEILVDDDTGRIVYKTDFFARQLVEQWFEQLRDGVQWRAEQMPMYERVVDVPRLIASFKLGAPDVPEPIRLMQPAIERFCAERFTSAGLNFYRDGKDSIAPHGDKLEVKQGRAPVALVSLGAPRRMTIRSVAKPRRILDRDLQPGSLLVMSYESHFTHLHGIPKTTLPVGQRISVAFRRSR